jgi:hypothetical protein
MTPKLPESISTKDKERLARLSAEVTCLRLDEFDGMAKRKGIVATRICLLSEFAAAFIWLHNNMSTDDFDAILRLYLDTAREIEASHTALEKDFQSLANVAEEYSRP